MTGPIQEMTRNSQQREPLPFVPVSSHEKVKTPTPHQIIIVTMINLHGYLWHRTGQSRTHLGVLWSPVFLKCPLRDLSLRRTSDLQIVSRFTWSLVDVVWDSWDPVVLVLSLQMGEVLYEERLYPAGNWACVTRGEDLYEQSISMAFMKLMRFICKENSAGQSPPTYSTPRPEPQTRTPDWTKD